MNALDELLAKQRLAELVAAYSRAADRADERLLASLFHADAVCDSGVIRAEGKEFARRFVAWTREYAAALSHCACSSWFAVDGDHATGETYVLAMCRLHGHHGGGQSLVAGRYLDRFERRAGEWKFSSRRFVVDCEQPPGANAAEAMRPEEATRPLRGSFKPTDPV
ncbi:hypothetical protein ACG33_01315 [Steroidobacter denitrificans]|uniref:SnoaL-like domain-containing protein n=1 Tax=Steroidobacter denitrificans TaxID=465721 RepID=A0A127F837_STEDE|nr:nuclear transport factor 2 family protein [Steroidobacter denitrificans]AMN45765.1 hypothetical protein ACG33_01315 [Steroidobacter denitrificans]